MSGIRLTLLVLILGGLVVLTVQNLSPALPLVFLTFRTQALPLALWLLGAIVLGVMTTLLIAGVTGASSAATRSKWRSPRSNAGFRPSASPGSTQDYGAASSSSASSTRVDPGEPQDQPNETGGWSAVNPASWMSGWRSQSPSDRSSTAADSGWGASNQKEEWEDWEGYEVLNQPDAVHRIDDDLREFYELEDLEAPRRSPQSPSQPFNQPTAQSRSSNSASDASASSSEPVSRAIKDYEVPQEPKTVYRSGSIYSYSYREGAGQTEDIYARPTPEPPEPTDEAVEDVADDNTPVDRGFTANTSDEVSYPERPEPDYIDPNTPVYDAEYRVIVPPYPSADEERDPYTREEGFYEEDSYEDNRDRNDTEDGFSDEDYDDFEIEDQGPSAQQGATDTEDWDDWNNFIEPDPRDWEDEDWQSGRK